MDYQDDPALDRLYSELYRLRALLEEFVEGDSNPPVIDSHESCRYCGSLPSAFALETPIFADHTPECLVSRAKVAIAGQC